MKTAAPYPFYTSLRFRFGLIFGLLFLCFLLATGVLLYSFVKGQFEKSFAKRLQTQASLILQETEINPLTVPLPAAGEFFRLIYQANAQQDTLFDNVPEFFEKKKDETDPELWRYKYMSRALETGGFIRILYLLPAQELTSDINQVKLILFLYFPLSFLAALIAGYFLSGFLLRPIEEIVKKANDISLQNQINLLETPSVRDELHKLTDSLNQMLSRIKTQARNQNAFFASASHELRTPLSVMLTELQVLEKKGLSPEIKLIVENQIVEVQRLNKLVNDFLMMSQIKSGALGLTKTSVNLPELTFEILNRLSSTAELKNQTFKVRITPESGFFEIQNDPSHLVTILINLVGNAIKHGQRHSAIDIWILDNSDNVALEIRNLSGSKIINPELITDEFTKQDLQGDGFGLGLWIVSHLAESIGVKFQIVYEYPEFTAILYFKR